MRVPLGWLRDYVEIPLSTDELAERLTLAGLEVAAIHRVGVPGSALPWDPERVLVGEVTAVTPHPNADRLVLARVAYGDGRTTQVVTGAPNLRVGDAGQKVALALAGACLADPYAPTPTIATLAGRKVRGVFSDAMILSEKELGLSDDHTGVLILDPDLPVGAPLVSHLGEEVLDIEITPNMARCLSMLGVAREVAALTGGKARPPEAHLHAAGEPVDRRVAVAIEDPALSSRYAATLIDGVTIGASPAWLQRRLRLAGVRPISNVVDVTNYVMLELGQPLHAFDYDALARRAQGVPAITVRPARPGEVLVTLDGERRTLDPERLVIADTAGPIAVAGVMGGAETEVTPATRRVLLEAANFSLVSIRKTTQALKLPSEASARFGRGVSPALALPAAMRATALIQGLGGGAAAPGAVDCYPRPYVPPVVELSLRDVRRILGVALEREAVRRLLSALEFDSEPLGEDALRVRVPDYRLDIGEGAVGVADLLEEVARLIGYDRMPGTMLADALPPQRGNAAVDLEERVRDLLVTAGLQEIVAYRLTTPERERRLGAGVEAAALDYVRLANPISADRTVMRRTLLPGLLEAVGLNARTGHRLWLFEIGPVFLPAPSLLPAEPRRVAIAVRGPATPASWITPDPDPTDFYALKGVLEALGAGLHIAQVAFEPADHPTFVRGRTARMTAGDATLGVLGELHPDVHAAFDLPAGPTYVADLDLDAVAQVASLDHRVVPVPRYPPALRDLAVVVPDSAGAGALLSIIREAGAPLLADARPFDLYRGPQVAAGEKSLAFSLAFQAPDRTLTDAEVDAAAARVLQALVESVGARLRG